MKTISGGVCAPKGFSAGGIRCGIKPSSQKNDLALICSKNLCTASAMFTKNRVKAASVLISKKNLSNKKLRAVIVNSGNANACTGKKGIEAAQKMAQLASEILSIDKSEVAVASTGVIGVQLPIDLIENNIGALKESLRDNEEGHAQALTAIMTTDTRRKEIAVEIEIDGKPVHIGAMAKGSGMIHPNMATMLSFITTDAAINSETLDLCLFNAVRRSFNVLSVDGDTSTNDMVLVMANGEAGNNPISSYSKQNTEKEVKTDFKVFAEALEYVCVELTKMIARDGEGATKLIAVNVTGAFCDDTAQLLARSVAASNLVKTACFGSDANWGRVLCAMGYSRADFSPDKTTVHFSSKAGSVKVCEDGQTVPFSEEKAKEILREEEIEINISLQDGRGAALAWGCDLTYDYVKINGDYRS